jgi:acetyl esterase/lipase
MLRTLFRLVGVTALAAVITVALFPPLRGLVGFYYRLFRATRLADQFYANFPCVSKNIHFLPGSQLTLDVYQPEAGSGYPVVFYVYGGSWNTGNKELYAPAAQRLLPEGVVMVVPNYTLYPAAGYPNQTQEVAAALAWTLGNIANYGGDPSRVIVAAQSAGAQIAGLTVYDPRWLAVHGHSPAELRGFIGISGVYHIPTQLAHERRRHRSGQYVVDVMGGRENVIAASPSTYAGRQVPPTLLIHGDIDETVPLRMSLDLRDRLTAAGADCELRIYAGSGHAEIMFRALTENPPRLLDDMLAFTHRRTSRDGHGPIILTPAG